MASQGRPYRGDRGGRDRGAGVNRGGYQARGDHGGGYPPRGGRGDFAPRGGRGDFAPRCSGQGGGRGGGAPDSNPIFQGAMSQPSTEVRSKEDAIMASIKKLSLDPLQLASEFPLRPGYGSAGKMITLYANYFEVETPAKLPLYRYSITHIPDPKSKKVLAGKKGSWVVKLLLKLHFAESRDKIVTDYSNWIISTSALSLPQTRFEIQYRSELEDEPWTGAKKYVIEIAPAEVNHILHLSELIHHLTSSEISAACPTKADLIQALNIILGFQPNSDDAVLSLGSNKHFPTGDNRDFQPLGAGLEALRGYFVSVRPATSRLLVNVQVKHVACYEAIPLGLLMRRFVNANNLKRENEDDRRRLEKFVKLLRVRVTHIIRRNAAGQEIPRIRTVIGFARTSDGKDLPYPPKVQKFGDGANDVQFFLDNPSGITSDPSKRLSKPTPVKNGKQPSKPSDPQRAGEYITVAKFFEDRHGKVVQNPMMPVINVGDAKKPSYLPVDVCEVVPGQVSKTKLSPSQTTEMIEFAVREPAENATSITENGVQVLGIREKDNDTLKRFNLSVPPNLITVPGRIMTGPPVQYKDSTRVEPNSGSWNMRAKKFCSPATLPPWSYLRITIRGNNDAWDKDLVSFKATMDSFQANLRANGLILRNFIFPGFKLDLNGDPQDDAKFESIFDDFINDDRKPQVMLVILPKEDAAIYNQVKCLGDVRKGIHTICVVGKKFAKPKNNQYFANVALKFNLKLGGVNQSLDPANLGVLAEGKTMIVGLDVTHPSPGSVKSAPSVAGIVATIDKELGQWPGDVRIQTTPKKEMVDNLDDMFGSRLQLWYKRNKAWPRNILIYRDGVSEGQYQTVLDKELPQIRAACKRLYPPDTQEGIPYISIIVVGKRHHTRFYPTKTEDADASFNPQNGTIVDRGVTEARNWDFFLQAHTALKGTARPAHYYVILDEIFRKRKSQQPHLNAADALEKLTHNLCYLFGRATKAVSICPPAYYADLVCERARCYLSKLYDATPPETPAETVAGSDKGEGPEPNPDDVRIHDHLKNTMFYI